MYAKIQKSQTPSHGARDFHQMRGGRRKINSHCVPVIPVLVPENSKHSTSHESGFVYSSISTNSGGTVAVWFPLVIWSPAQGQDLNLHVKKELSKHEVPCLCQALTLAISLNSLFTSWISAFTGKWDVATFSDQQSYYQV